MDLEVQAKIANAFLFTKPAFQLFGCVGGAIVQNEDHGLDSASERFRKDDLLDKGLEIDKTLALAAGSVDLAIGNGEPSKQVARAATMVTGFVQHRLAWACWTRLLLAFT